MNNIDISSLSPFEYLYYLQNQFFETGEAQIAYDVCDLLTANILGSLPPDHRKKLENIPVGVLPTKQANAIVINVPSGGQIIAIDYGLMSLFTTLNKILICRLTSFLILSSSSSSSFMNTNCAIGFPTGNATGTFPRLVTSKVKHPL